MLAMSSWAARITAPTGYLDNKDAVPILIFQQPGSNALKTAQNVRAAMAQLSQNFPPDLKYEIVYDTSRFVAESVHDVFKTIFIAILLVVFVVIIFLQTWRASIIPIVAIPVSLIGTFGVMAAARLFAQHPVAVRPGARSRHRGR